MNSHRLHQVSEEEIKDIDKFSASLFGQEYNELFEKEQVELVSD